MCTCQHKQYLVTRARVVALRSIPVAVEILFDVLFGGAPAFYPVLGGHEGGTLSNAVVIAELDGANHTSSMMLETVWGAGDRLIYAIRFSC